MPPLKNINKPSSANKNRISGGYDGDSSSRKYTSGTPKVVSGKRRIKDFDLEMLGLGKFSAKKSQRTPKAFQPVIVTYSEKLKDLLDSETTSKSLKDIEAENSKLMDQFKDLNQELTKVMERVKLSALPPKKVEFKHKNAQDQIRTITKEISNQQQILEFCAAEYTTLKARLDKIKDHGYVMDLEDRIQEVVAKTEEVKKKNRDLSLKAGNLGKEMNVIEKAHGVAPSVKEENEKARELAVIKRKLKKLQDTNEHFESESKIKNKRFDEVMKENKTLCRDAEKLKVNGEPSRLEIQYKQLKAQVKNLEDYIRVASNTNEKYLRTQLERDVEDLYSVGMKNNEHMMKLDEIIEQQKAALQEMIEKEEDNSDLGVHEVLEKIKKSINQEKNEGPRSARLRGSPQKSKDSAGNLKPKPPSNAVKKAPMDIYADLPLFSPSDMKGSASPNKRDLIKKELSAIKEKAKRDVEEEHARSPSVGDGGRKRKEFKIESGVKSSVGRVREKKEQEVKEVLQQVEQERPKPVEKKVEEKIEKVESVKKSTDSSPEARPAFSKPNLFKKNKIENDELTVKEELIGVEEDIVKGNDFSNPVVNAKKKEEVLGINAGNNRQSPFLTETEPVVTRKKEELTLPGTLKVEPKPLEMQGQVQKTNELTLGDNFKPISKQQVATNNIQDNQNEDTEDNFNIGGLSRLNRVKRLGNNNNITPVQGENKEALYIPGQKAALTLNTNNPTPVQNENKDGLYIKDQKPGLTLNSNSNNNLKLEPSKNVNQEDTIKVGTRVKATDPFADNLNKSPLTLGNGNNVLGGEALLVKEPQPRRVGRDRSHLLGAQKPEDDISIAKNEISTNVTNAKSTFDPDDIFNSNNKTNKPEILGAPNTNANNNVIPGVRTGRGGVATRPRQITPFDDAAPIIQKQNVESKEKVTGPLGFGGGGSQNQNGLGFGGAAFRANDGNKGGLVLENKVEEEQKPRRMRMGEAKPNVETVKEKEKNLTQKAGGGFFGELDDF